LYRFNLNSIDFVILTSNYSDIDGDWQQSNNEKGVHDIYLLGIKEGPRKF